MDKNDAEELLEQISSDVPKVKALAVVPHDVLKPRGRPSVDYGVGYEDRHNGHVYIVWAKGDAAHKRLGLGLG